MTSSEISDVLEQTEPLKTALNEFVSSMPFWYAFFKMDIDQRIGALDGDVPTAVGMAGSAVVIQNLARMLRIYVPQTRIWK